MDKNINKPKVAVIMATWNSGRYICQAIESVLNQTFKDFELIVIDDCSTDKSPSIVKSFDDQRIKYIRNDKNLGAAISRNIGITTSSAPYIAILDSDDIALPKRLEIQASFLDRHDDFALVGSAARLIDENGDRTGVIWRSGLSTEMMIPSLLFQNRITHSSVMMRRTALPKQVYRDLNPAEDYDLWTRIEHKWKMTSIKKILVEYRLHGQSISNLKVERKEQLINQIIREQLANLGVNPTDEELTIHRNNYKYIGDDVIVFLHKREKWLLRLEEANLTTKYYDQEVFHNVLCERWLSSTSAQSRIGIKALKIYWHSTLRNLSNPFLWQIMLRFIIKCIIKINRQ